MAMAVRTPAILLVIVVSGKVYELVVLLHFVSTLCCSFFCTACSQNIVFDTLPMNQTVEERRDATFSCSGTVDGTSQPTRYTIRRGTSVLQIVGLNISDLVTVDGIEAALVFGDFNSQLLLRNITREANGYTVSCAIRVGAFFPETMNASMRHVTVLCKCNALLHVLNVVDHRLM